MRTRGFVSDSEIRFKLPRKFENVLALLSNFYAQKNLPLQQKLIVNSKYYLEENVDSYYEGSRTIYGHAVHFLVSQSIYANVILGLDDFNESLRQSINQLIHSSVCEDEYICRVYFELDEGGELQNWRENSGVLIQETSLAQIKNQDDLDKIWERGFFKLFISHVSSHKKIAVQLKSTLFNYGISCFVAHEDIEPSSKWQDEIEKALGTADALIPLLIRGFTESKWTDQEIGIAIGRGISVFPIRFDLDPYGFIGKYQAITFKGKAESHSGKELENLARNIFELMFENVATQERIVDAMINKMETSVSFEQTNNLMRYLSKVKVLPLPLVDRLEQAYKSNSQVREAFGAESKLPILIKGWRHNKS